MPCVQFYLGILCKLLEFSQSYFQGTQHFVFRGASEGHLFLELEYAYSLGTDLWWINSCMLSWQFYVIQKVVGLIPNEVTGFFN
jgi:hypothetical protein